MFIISLYHIKLIPLPHNLQNYLYGQNQINHINGFRTLILGGWLPQWFEPLLPDALPCRAAQIDWPIKQGYRFADGNVACVRQLLGKTFFGGRHQRPANPPRPWPQTYPTACRPGPAVAANLSWTVRTRKLSARPSNRTGRA